MIGIILNSLTAVVNRNPIKEVLLITTRQVKAARALLGWSQADLAACCGVSEPTIARLEAVEGDLGGRKGTAEKIRNAIESAGVEFTNGDEPGVKLARAIALRHAESSNQSNRAAAKTLPGKAATRRRRER